MTQTDKEQSVVSVTKRWSDKAVSTHNGLVWENVWTQANLVSVLYIYLSVYIYVHICTCICTYIYIYTYIYTDIDIDIDIDIDMYIHVYIYVDIYIKHVWTQTNLLGVPSCSSSSKVTSNGLNYN